MLTVRKFRNFSSGYLEESSQRILNIFFLLKANSTKCVFHYLESLYQTIVVQVKFNQLILYVPDFEYKSNRPGKLYFEIMNRYHYCEVSIIKCDINQITIEFPHQIYYLKDRRYPRVKFDDLFIRFNIIYSFELRFQKHQISIENKYTDFIQEISKDSPSLILIYRILFTHIKKIGDDFSIIMFHKKQPESYTLYEKILLKTQKTVLIEDVSRTESYVEKIPSPNLINLSEYYERKKSEIGKLGAAHEIEKFMKADLKNFLVSYLMTPINIYGDIIGYIRIQTNQFHKYRIHRLLADDFHTSCEIFSSGLTKIRIYRSYFMKNSATTRVLNISANGLLFETFDKLLFEYLKKFTRIKIIIPIFSRELELHAEIVRFFSKSGGYYMGVQIFKGDPGHLRVLKDYINENLRYDFF